MTGMAFGAGSAVAHKAVDGLMGGGGHGGAHGGSGEMQEGGAAPAGYASEGGYAQQEQQMENPCMSFNSALLQCLQTNNSEIGLCQNYMNDVVTCEKNYMNSL